MALILNFSRSQDYKDGFCALTALQHQQDRMIPVPAWLEATSNIVRAVEGLYNQPWIQQHMSEKRHNQIIARQSLLGQELAGYTLAIGSLISRSREMLSLVRKRLEYMFFCS